MADLFHVLRRVMPGRRVSALLLALLTGAVLTTGLDAAQAAGPAPGAQAARAAGATTGPTTGRPSITPWDPPTTSEPPWTGQCDPQWSTATLPTAGQYDRLSPTQIRFVYSAPAGAGCAAAPAWSRTTVSVYSDAAGRNLVGQGTSGVGSTRGWIRVNGLLPSVDYYYSVQAGNTSPHGGILGPVRTPVTTEPSVTPTFPPDWCELYASGTLRSATSTTLALDYSISGAGACNKSTALDIATGANGANVVQHLSTPTASDAGAIEVTGLTPDTAYYYRFAGGAFFPGAWVGPVRTLPLGSGPTTTTTGPAPNGRCTAVMTVRSDWGQGFLAEVKITNTGTTALTGWTVDWAWTHGEHLESAYSARSGGSATHPTLTGEDWNSRLAAGGSTSAFVLGSGSLADPVPGLACSGR
jgi:Cellulose binding domain